MADAGLFIGWGEVVRGRESEATELLAETLGYYARLQEEGVIELWTPEELIGRDVSVFG